MKVRIAVEAEYEVEGFYDADIMDAEKNIVVAIKDHVRKLGGDDLTVSIKENV